MRTIQTMNGAVAAENLGPVLMHEHFLYGYAGFQGDQTIGGFDEETVLTECLEAAELAKSYGIQTVVDATTNECGRDVRFLKKIQELSGLNIICSTGYYFEAESAYAYWEFRDKMTDIGAEILEMYRKELTEGIGDTGIRAGVIKLASSYRQISPIEEKFFTAAGKAQKETGCNIITHTQLGTMGPEQAKLLINHGADPGRIAIGHMCGNTNIDYHKEVLSYGVYINLDRFGLEGELFHTPTDWERIDLIERLLEAGYEDRILLGHDSVIHQLGRPNVMNAIMQEALANANIGDLGFRVIPEMKKRGFRDETIHKFLVENPARFFG